MCSRRQHQSYTCLERTSLTTEGWKSPGWKRWGWEWSTPFCGSLDGEQGQNHQLQVCRCSVGLGAGEVTNLGHQQHRIHMQVLPSLPSKYVLNSATVHHQSPLKILTWSSMAASSLACLPSLPPTPQTSIQLTEPFKNNVSCPSSVPSNGFPSHVKSNAPTAFRGCARFSQMPLPSCLLPLFLPHPASQPSCYAVSSSSMFLPLGVFTVCFLWHFPSREP